MQIPPKADQNFLVRSSQLHDDRTNIPQDCTRISNVNWPGGGGWGVGGGGRPRYTRAGEDHQRGTPLHTDTNIPQPRNMRYSGCCLQLEPDAPFPRPDCKQSCKRQCNKTICMTFVASLWRTLRRCLSGRTVLVSQTVSHKPHNPKPTLTRHLKRRGRTRGYTGLHQNINVSSQVFREHIIVPKH